MDVFCVIAELKPEFRTYGPEGGTFKSEKDERISVYFPLNAVQKETKFTFTSDYVDLDRFQEYQKQNEAFRCISGFTNLLTVLPSTHLTTEGSLSLPLDKNVQEEDCQIMILHWEKRENEEEDVTVLECHPEPPQSSAYRIPVKNFSGHCVVAAKRTSPIQDIIRTAKHAFGKLHMCIIMTFIDYDEQYKVHHLLVDCVEFTKKDIVAEMHREDGMVEVKHSRSRDIELKDKAKIKISIDGSIKHHVKTNRTNSFSFHKMAQTNHVYIPFTVTTGQDCNVRFYWGQEDHKVYFSLEQVKVKKSMKKKVRVLQEHSSKTPQHPKGNMPTSKYSRGPSSARELQRQGSTYADLHPVLTDKSLAALADSLPGMTWQSVGIELDFTMDTIITIFEKAEKIRSNPGFELLRIWRERKTGKQQETLIDQLMEAFKELKRNDVVEVICSAKSQSRRISRSDMDVMRSAPVSPTSSFHSYCSSRHRSIDENTDSVLSCIDTDQSSVNSTETLRLTAVVPEIETEDPCQPGCDTTHVKRVDDN